MKIKIEIKTPGEEKSLQAVDFVSWAIQRRLRIGYARAARLLDMLEEAGLVDRADGSKSREVLKNNSL
ncbi:MAG: DNA translocase FtsK [Candidatus Woykebacteria bacterium]